MELYEQLPLKITTKNNQIISDNLLNRLNYEWKLIHELSLTSLPISHMMSRSFKELCRSNCIDLDSYLTKRLCNWCSIIQIPSVTCRVRLRKRTKRSKINKDNNTNKNEIVYHCLTCNKISYRTSVCQKITQPVKKSTSTPINSTPNQNIQKLNKKFNFIEMLNRKETPKKVIDFPLESDFISLNSTPNQNNHNLNSNQKKRVSLLELEESNKNSKKKQKKIENQGPQNIRTTNFNSNSNQSNSNSNNNSLGSLKSLFKSTL